MFLVVLLMVVVNFGLVGVVENVVSLGWQFSCCSVMIRFIVFWYWVLLIMMLVLDWVIFVVIVEKLVVLGGQILFMRILILVFFSLFLSLQVVFCVKGLFIVVMVVVFGCWFFGRVSRQFVRLLQWLLVIVGVVQKRLLKFCLKIFFVVLVGLMKSMLYFCVMWVDGMISWVENGLNMRLMLFCVISDLQLEMIWLVLDWLLRIFSLICWLRRLLFLFMMLCQVLQLCLMFLFGFEKLLVSGREMLMMIGLLELFFLFWFLVLEQVEIVSVVIESVLIVVVIC